MSLEGREEWVIIEFNGLEVFIPISPVASLLLRGSGSNCVEGGKL
jgi:hypothetical protein